MEWNITNKRFVGFFDIMGFKDLVSRNEHNIIYTKLLLIKEFLARYEELGKDHTLEFASKAIIRHAIFSDSILIISNSDDENDADLFINRCNHLIWHCFDNGIPIKGALSHGILTADFGNSIFFGQPLIDAYLLQDDLLFYGGILDNNIEKRIGEFNSTNKLFLNRFYPYEAPTKSGKITHLCLKWLSSPLNDNNKIMVQNFYYIVSGRPRIYVDNTIKFVDWIFENKRRFKI